MSEPFYFENDEAREVWRVNVEHAERGILNPDRPRGFRRMTFMPIDNGAAIPHLGPSRRIT